MVFSEIIGQVKATALLSRALEGNRLAHGYLFTGPDGVGKTTTARALAASLFCTVAPADRPCGRCSGCIKFASGNHPDFLAIRPDGATIKIAQVRALKKDLSFSPFEARTRVVLIEDVQAMTREAGNSLLKILEEPPAENLLLLIASESEPVLPTIVSRCQVIPFFPLSLEQTTAVLQRLHPDLPSDEVHTLAELAAGSPGRVEALHSDDLMVLYRDCIQALMETTSNSGESVERALGLAARMAELKGGLDALFNLLAQFFKEGMVATLGNREELPCPEADAARERWNLQQLSVMIKAVDSARKGLAANCNRGLVCEVLLMELFFI